MRTVSEHRVPNEARRGSCVRRGRGPLLRGVLGPVVLRRPRPMCPPRPGNCSWFMLPPAAMRMSVSSAAAKRHERVHGACCSQRPYRCLRSEQASENMLRPEVCSISGGHEDVHRPCYHRRPGRCWGLCVPPRVNMPQRAMVLPRPCFSQGQC